MVKETRMQQLRLMVTAYRVRDPIGLDRYSHIA